MGCHALLQGIFPTQGSNSGLQHCRQILYDLSCQGSPIHGCAELKCPMVGMGLGDEFHYFFIAREGGQQRVKAPYKQPQTSAFHLACVWKSGFLPLTLNDLTLSEGSCFGGRRCSAAPHPWGGGEGGGAGRWPPGLQFQLVWVKGGREKSCENCLGHLCWPPSSKNRSQACSQAASFQRL